MNGCSGLCGCPEDDTIFSERTASTFGNVVICRSVLPVPGGFIILSVYLSCPIATLDHQYAQTDYLLWLPTSDLK